MQEPAATEFPPPRQERVDLLIIAGEYSGDEHASALLSDLMRLRPELNVACLGGPNLEAAGAQLLYDLTEVSIVGFVEVVRHYRFFKKLFEHTLDWIERYRPAEICFVDYPGFNLRIAEALRLRGLSRKGGGDIRLSYYISPQIWAWKSKRRFLMARALDRLGVIFPFEVDCFADTDLPVTFVGHPFVRTDREPPLLYDASAPVLLLPGSRAGAVGRIFPILLQAFKQAVREKTALQARVVYPSAGIRKILEACLEKVPGVREHIRFVHGTGREMAASAILTSSGTMSLNCALAGIPGAIVYRLNPASYWLGRVLIRVPYIGIGNLLLNRPLHPEYIQSAARPEVLARELIHALEDPEAARRAQEGAEELKELLHAGSDACAARWLAGP
ncbi:MAG: lipid-A-disaccharide synthase [Opitutales bacterium]